jgi:uncharacterized membrane protein YgcG
MKRFAVLIAAFLSIPIAPAFADERITDFSSDISIAETGTLTVVETISVVSEGDQIRHGIFRVIPTAYRDRLGRRVRVSFNVLSVKRDGREEPYTVDAVDDGERIKIGSADVLVEPGGHTYAITYTTGRQIGFFDDYDELYWNVTGNFWDFRIDHARAKVKLPFGARVKQYDFYTGEAGSKAKNAEAEQPYEREIEFATTGPLGYHEGLTIAVGFSKGAVIPPTAAELRDQFIRDNAGTIVASAGVLILFIYFMVAWYTHGRDPKRGVVIPLFAPPKDFSPAAVRYVHRMAYDRKSYAASLVNMAVKGYLTIAEMAGIYTLARTGKSEREAGLADTEEAIGRALFATRDFMELRQENHSRVSASITALKNTLKSEYEKIYFVTNQAWHWGGMAILAVTALATAFLCDNPESAVFILAWLTGWSVGTAFLLHRCYDAWLSAFEGPGSRILNTISAIFSSVFALPFVGGLIFGLTVLSASIALLASLVLVGGGAMAYLFYHLLKAPTLAGAKIFDEIDGFRLYLVTAEKDRFEKLNPPEVTPAVFEKYLPYAIALDCENEWSRKFEAEAAAAGIDPDTARSTYSPAWYSGSSFSNFGAAGLAGSLGASMASAAASAATAPGSSSGSGGGGSSGGGGGGGGGGGW